jgi:RNA polymerase sigma-70 factor (ECF subfamily)
MDIALKWKKNEHEFILAVRRRERWALKKLYEENYDLLYPVCLRYAQREEEAEDILHEGFIKIFRHIEKYQPGTSLRSWMKRIMVNAAIDHYREGKRKHTEEITPMLHIRSKRPDILSKITVDEILAALRQLSPTYRTVFNMFVMEGFSHREIAEKLNITESTSRSNLVKARNKLKSLLLPKEDYYG